MSAPESLINGLYRAGNISTKQIQQLISNFQSVPKQIDEDIDEFLIILNPETRIRQTSLEVNPGTGNDIDEETRERYSELGYIKLIPNTVNVYPLSHTYNGTGSYSTTTRQFAGGWSTDGTYYQSIADATRLNPTTEITIAGWIYVPTAITSGHIIFKNTQYKLTLNGSSLEWNVNSKTPVSGTISKDAWVHFVAIYDTVNGHKLYIDNSLSNSDSETGNINTSSNNLGVFGTPSGTTLLGNGVLLSNLSIINGEVDSTWVGLHYNGLLDTRTYTEIMTIPFVAHDKPKPDASVGRCEIN